MATPASGGATYIVDGRAWRGPRAGEGVASGPTTQAVAHWVKGGHRRGTTDASSPPITAMAAERVGADGSHPSASPTLAREGHPPVSQRPTDTQSRVKTDHDIDIGTAVNFSLLVARCSR
eukprot:4885685-Pleurochrysis_carterae.AAC.1